jgi:hypothetical protein
VRLLNRLTTLSLILFVAVCVFWLQSLDRWRSVALPWCVVSAEAGHVSLSGTTDTPGEAHYGCLGFSFVRTHRTYTPSWEVRAPVWFFAVATAAAPVLGWRKRVRQRRRRAEGLCPSCGYDLRATPECCPECGTAPTPVVGGA